MPTQSGKDNSPPKVTVKCNGCHGNIFENAVKDSPTPLYKATFNRIYTDQGKFKTVVSYREQDMPYLIVTAIKAWLQMIELKQQAWDASRTDASETADEEVD